MQFDLDMDAEEASDGVGQPIASGTYLFVVTECKEFVADSGSAGVNTTMRAVCTGEDTDQHGRYARPTFWSTKKGAKFLKGWMVAAKVPFTAKGFNPSDAVGKVFFGRIRSYKDDDGYDKQDMLHVESVKEEDMKEASAFIAEWTGKDKPPASVGGGISMTKQDGPSSPAEEDDMDDGDEF